MSKVLIISTSLRADSNSEYLARQCERGARDAGNDVEFISLKGKKINFCIGCLACQESGVCVIKDDVAEIADKVKNADTLVFATPIYYYEMSGQMKTLIDRLNPLYVSDYKFTNIYMIATAADEGAYVFEKAYAGLSGFSECFEKSAMCGIATGGGLQGTGEAKDYEDAARLAYELGQSL